MKVALIAVLDENNGIGKNNKLLCHLPADLKHFKLLTSGHSVIMGRKTFESLPNGPLPNRRNIILTRNENYKIEGTFVFHSIEELIETCKNEDKIFVIGGAEVYHLFIPKADILYITRIHHQFEADTFFPAFFNKEWQLVQKEDYLPDERNKYAYSFLEFARI